MFHAIAKAGERIDSALCDFDFRRATAAVWAIVDEANRYINRTRPWTLAPAGSPPAPELDAILSALLLSCRVIADHLSPFLPDLAARITNQCTPIDNEIPPATQLQPRLAASKG
ncbi:hypothetical protein [Nocardia brasiliensis]|uniref:hypothetical protein n=1 Tax=Nocardia brasiliensis TaxID=37326 RepID=UPI002455088F|nr:hypothetical protein [Nocardia brasiliensis]